MPTTKPRPASVDEYLAAVKPAQRVALENLRRTIRAIVPDVEECISYGLAAFRWRGRPLVAFGATANHCAFYPMSARTVADFAKELASYETSKGTIRFSDKKPIPAKLIKRLVKARLAERNDS